MIIHDAAGKPIEYTIAPHPAVKEVHGVTVQVVKDLYQVLVDGARVAYCGIVADKPICFIRHYDPEFVDVVAEFVTREIGKPNKIAIPPNPHNAAPADDESYDEPSPLWLPDDVDDE